MLNLINLNNLIIKEYNMSSLDYMDIDVSSRLSKFVQARRNFNEVMKQLEYYAEFNINIQHLGRISRETEVRARRRRGMGMGVGVGMGVGMGMGRAIMKPWENKELCYATRQIVDTRYKSEYLHVWPTKPPTFAANQSGITRVNRDNAVIKFVDGSTWKLKKYTPERYKPRNLASMCKEIKLE